MSRCARPKIAPLSGPPSKKIRLPQLLCVLASLPVAYGNMIASVRVPTGLENTKAQLHLLSPLDPITKKRARTVCSWFDRGPPSIKSGWPPRAECDPDRLVTIPARKSPTHLIADARCGWSGAIISSRPKPPPVWYRSGKACSRNDPDSATRKLGRVIQNLSITDIPDSV